MNKRRIGILGGTFNPPHFGHLIMANEAYYALGLDEVRFMPNAIAPHKESSGIDTHTRVEMTRLAIEGQAHFRLEDIEVSGGGVSYTYDTMVKLIEREPECEFYFIIGGDMVESLHSWHRIDELAELVQFVGIGRPGYIAETDYPVMMIDSPEMHLSSTMLRERVLAGKPLTFFVPEQVETFIQKERLYGPEPDAPKVKERLPEKRFNHVVGVMNTAVVLAKQYGVPEEQARIAAILHDVVKFADREWMRSIIEKESMDPLLLDYHHELWHAPVGAYVANYEFGVKDEAILDAIRYHTTGRAGMSDLEKIIYIADMIEPSRKFPGVDRLRAMKNDGLDRLMEASIRQSIEFLASKNQPVYPDSLKCLEHFEQQKGNVKND